MDPFTQKLLEKTRERRDKLQAKLQQSSTPAAATRKRKPLHTDSTAENAADEPPKLDLEKSDEKRRRSSTRRQASQSVCMAEGERENVRSEVGVEEAPKPATRKGRLQMLANQINNWEDDLSHPQPTAVRESPEKTVPVKPADTQMETGGQEVVRPPKPPRAHEGVQKPTRRSPRIQKQISSVVTDAFTFGSASKQAPARVGKPPTPLSTHSVVPQSNGKNSDDEPTKKAVADRFSMWEKKAGDALTPLRQATPLHGARARPATKASFAGPSAGQSQTSEYKPEERSRPARRRSRSAVPIPERERTGASAPQQKPASSAGSQVKPPQKACTAASAQARPGTDSENAWCSKKDEAFAKAPMSARKGAWEAKIAEQQAVASEHNKVMYRTRSLTRMEESSRQKRDAESQLKQGQVKLYDPAERAKKEREAELERLQNRFNKKGLLRNEEDSTDAPSPAARPLTSSVESLDQEYYTASDSEMLPVESSSNNATAGSSADERLKKRQVSFKSPTRAGSRRKSSSSDSDHELERKVQRRSSCKLPKLGCGDSSSEEEMTPKSKFYNLQSEERMSASTIPRLGDESSADDGMPRQTSCSSMGSSVSSSSYYFVGNGELPPQSRDVVDFLDEALSEEETTPEPRKSPRRVTPVRRETRSSKSDSPTAMFSIDQYRQKTKSVATLPASSAAMKPVSVYDTDDTYSDSSQSSSYSDSDRRKRVKELQEMVKQEQNVIIQASNALNQCCKSGSTFAGSTEQVECNRLLLIACQRRQAYLMEIERIKTNPHSYLQMKGKGSLTISDIQLPLKREFVKKIGTPEDDTAHYFLLMVRSGAQVIVTQMVSTHDAMMRGTLHFPNLIKLNDIMNDFKYELEVYGMQVSRDSVRQSARKDKKYKSSSISRSREASQSATNVRTTSFTHITSLLITMDSVSHSSFKLSRVPYLSPLHGSIHLTLRCTMQANIVFKGFINMFEDVGGFGAWHRRWCVLAHNRVSYWKYPDDETVKEPIGELDLKDCVTSQIGLVSRDKCARANTIELVVTRPASKADAASGKQIKDRLVYEQHWFGMDTKADRVEWCAKLNEALANVRQWYSDAARPIASKRTEI